CAADCAGRRTSYVPPNACLRLHVSSQPRDDVDSVQRANDRLSGVRNEGRRTIATNLGKLSSQREEAQGRIGRGGDVVGPEGARPRSIHFCPMLKLLRQGVAAVLSPAGWRRLRTT